ncbi:hypothetical protein HMPREF9451_01504 [Slackia piriformis YIT 12062]|uniref:Uncharacterized protein n=2 Tax=Slackia piriformis TaxID=626934 RepID=K0YL72_9ACTN|nr:hypothetical protein HMPREF9451_01504 [Slackia piriformis YIT 12062]
MEAKMRETHTNAVKRLVRKAAASSLAALLAVTMCPLMPSAAFADEAENSEPAEQTAPNYTATDEAAAVSASADESTEAGALAADATETGASDASAAEVESFSTTADVAADAASLQVDSASAGATEAIPSDAIRIVDFPDLLTAVLASRTQDTAGKYYYLDLQDAPGGVLDLSTDQVDQIIGQLGSLTFGSKDNPFKGTFDGNGYTIKGLNYQRDLWVPKPDTGLFAWTDGATIKNINFEDAYVGADYRGGVIVGYGKNTRIEHVKLVNCTSSVTPANNAVSLITNAGLAGGMVAGELDGCKLYDVEVQGGRVVNNSTVAVSGLGGEGLYLGAIVGIAKNSTVEYSRVTPVRSIGANGVTVEYTYTEVKNSYDVAVGAVAGQAVYAGGIVGGLYSDGPDARAALVDCFSTAECHTYAGTYVSVGAGNVGYVGGLAARTDNTVYLVRCHYAGNLYSELYNALLVIPIIQRNLYLGGLIEWDNDGLAVISDCYFNRTRSNTPGTNKDIPAVGIGKRYAGPSFGEQSDTTYIDRSFWEWHDYDFEGGKIRKTPSLGGAEHVNKWVMDYDLGMPVHGDSVKATLDYPGAGEVTIGTSDVLATQTSQSTANPYDFAVQGFVSNDIDMDFTATTNAVGPDTTPLVSDAANNLGYRFKGWYREPRVTVNHIDESHTFFDPIVSDGTKCASTDAAYIAKNTGSGMTDGFAGDDLFVAYYQGHVLFHDVLGNVIELDGTANTSTGDDWYNHEAALPSCAEPAIDRSNGVSASAKLIGWTTEKNPDTGGGWPAVTSTALGDMKNNGHFFVAGDPVLQPMDLYPVYSDYSTNIITVFEGNEQDALDDPTLRDGVGRTDVSVDGDRFTISASGAQPDGSLPAGYRFRGWFETDETGKEWLVSTNPSYTLPADADLTHEHHYIARFSYRVQAWLPTERPKHPNEYCYSDYYANDKYTGVGLYATAWLPYEATGSEVAAAFVPPSVRDTFHRWTDHANMKNYAAYKDDFIVNYDELCAMVGAPELPDIATSFAGLIEPIDIDAIVTYASGTPYDVVTFTDFPASTEKYDLRFYAQRGQIDVTARPGYRISGIIRFTTAIDTLDTTSKHGHNDISKLEWNGRNATWDDIGQVYDTDAQNVYLLKASADVNFLDKDGNLILTPDSPKNLNDVFTSPNEPAAFPNEATVTRKCDSLLFNPAGTATQAEASLTMLEASPFGSRSVPVGLGAVETSLDPAVAGGAPADPVTGDTSGRFICVDGVYYGFLGWVCSEDLTSDELSHAFVNGAPTLGSHGYVATSAANAEPYLLTEHYHVKHAMTVEPVYAKFDIDTTTNIARAGVPAGSEINIPQDPSYAVQKNSDGTFSAALAADIATKVTNGSDELYKLVSLTVEREDGHVETVEPTAAAANEFLYTLKPGEHYTFVANYEPLPVVFHTSEGMTQTVVHTKGDVLGDAPSGSPSFNMDSIDSAVTDRVVFVGWTETRPANGGEYVIDSADAPAKLVSKKTIVDHPMELFAVYRAANVGVQSNIDRVIGSDPAALAAVRTIEREFSKDQQTGQQSTCSKDATLMLHAFDYPGYEFEGWYADYQSDANPGTLVSAASRYVLTDAGLYQGKLYTAVYKQVHEVRYHGIDGDVLFTAKVPSDSGRSFVETVEVDGKQQETIIDAQAWTLIADQLASKSAEPSAQVNLLFKEWHWVKSDGTSVSWDSFYTAPIAESMDLYPIVYQVDSKDASGTPNTSDLWWVIDSSSTAGQPVKAYFKNGYDQDKLTVHVSKATYAPTGVDGATEAVETPVEGVNVGLFVSPVSVEPLVDATDAQGDAVFTFGASTLTIAKTTKDSGAAGRTFSFTVTNVVTQEHHDVNVQVSDTPDGDGLYTGSVTLDVPLGRYLVTEDESWAWRYTPAISIAPSSGTASVDGGFDVAGPVTVTCENTLANSKWFDDDARAKNVFAPQNAAANQGKMTEDEA